ncbi:MAG: HIRAN domain-containing protein [Thermoleophilia bacterium]|nr:HIRAN domain-containing protein [Thermoleophilia bacterium]
MDRRSFLKSMFAAVFLPFLPKGLSVEKEQHEVWLQSSLVAGFKYYDGEKVWYSLKVGELLALSREPNNPHDNQAVEVLWRGHKLGYIPRYENSTAANLLQNNAPLLARISNLDEPRNFWKQVELDIFLLVDSSK